MSAPHIKAQLPVAQKGCGHQICEVSRSLDKRAFSIKMMIKLFARAKSMWLLLGCVIPVNLNAGELRLRNNDLLAGEMLSIKGGMVTFSSDSFGILKLAIDRVLSFSSSDQWAVFDGTKDCVIEELSASELNLGCAKKPEQSHTVVDIAVNKPVLTGVLALSGTWARGNKNEANLDLSGGFSLRKGDLKNELKVDYESRYQDDKSSDEEYKIRYSTDWFFLDKWFWFNHLETGASEKKRIDERYEISSGFGFQVWDDESKALAVESGLSYIHELFDKGELDDNNFESSKDLPSWRWALVYSYSLPYSLDLSYSQAVLYSFGDSKEWDIGSDLSLKAPIADGLFSQFKLEYDYDSAPQEGNKKSDYKFSIGLGFEW